MLLKDCCAFQEGYVNPSQKVPAYFGGDIKWLRASDLNGGFVYDTERKLSNAGYKSAGKSATMFPVDSLAISKSGTIGVLGILKAEMCGNRAVINIRVNSEKADLHYIFYTLKNSTELLLGKTGGSIQRNLYVSALETVSLAHDRLAEQQGIAAVLSSLDAKIDLNHRINAELEALAKTIYDYWFVQFDFPDAHGRPYKSSGGAMVWNDTLKREIPAGWVADSVRSVAELGGGGTPSKSTDDFWNGDIPFFSPADAVDGMFQFDTTDHITPAGLCGCSSPAYPTGTVFVTARGSVGKVVIAGRSMAMNQSCYALRPKAETFLPFLYFHARTLVEHLKVKASGSTFNSIVTNDIDWTSLVSPPKSLIEKFHKSVRPMFDRIAAATLENAELTQLRDWLLPLLMNGQVRVA